MMRKMALTPLCMTITDHRVGKARRVLFQTSVATTVEGTLGAEVNRIGQPGTVPRGTEVLRQGVRDALPLLHTEHVIRIPSH